MSFFLYSVSNKHVHVQHIQSSVPPQFLFKDNATGPSSVKQINVSQQVNHYQKAHNSVTQSDVQRQTNVIAKPSVSQRKPFSTLT